jgi:L-alanine-DL-glutamate epimerase-like enolase superfamily enzyme
MIFKKCHNMLSRVPKTLLGRRESRESLRDLPELVLIDVATIEPRLTGNRRKTREIMRIEMYAHLLRSVNPSQVNVSAATHVPVIPRRASMQSTKRNDEEGTPGWNGVSHVH